MRKKTCTIKMINQGLATGHVYKKKQQCCFCPLVTFSLPWVLANRGIWVECRPTVLLLHQRGQMYCAKEWWGRLGQKCCASGITGRMKTVFSLHRKWVHAVKAIRILQGIVRNLLILVQLVAECLKLVIYNRIKLQLFMS